MMLAGKGKLIAIAGVALLVAAVAGSAGVVVAQSGEDDDEQPISGSALDQASRAALEHTGGGTVTDTEVEDEESLYEVEVTREDGSQVDVQLDESFNVVGDEEDDDGASDDD